MSIRLLSVNDKDDINVKQYICDSEDEKGNVETDFPGSKLFVIASGKEYKLGEDGSWIERNGTGGGSAPTQTKTATPTTSSQDVEPDSGYLLSKVTVAAIPSQYIIPTGTKSISENGTGIDVTQYAAVDVAVSGGGKDVVTGTIYFENEQSTAPIASEAYVLTHNLGKTPSGVVWMLAETASENIDSNNLKYGSSMAGEIITAAAYCNINNGSSSASTSMKYLMKPSSAQTVWTSLDANATTITLFIASSTRTSKRIPAGSTIRWFVW